MQAKGGSNANWLELPGLWQASFPVVGRRSRLNRIPACVGPVYPPLAGDFGGTITSRT